MGCMVTCLDNFLLVWSGEIARSAQGRGNSFTPGLYLKICDFCECVYDTSFILFTFQTSWASPRWAPDVSTPNSSTPQSSSPSHATRDPNFGTEQDPKHCSFYLKTGACRFKEQCSRQHPHPQSSTTLMLPGMFTSLGFMEQLVDDRDQDTALEVSGMCFSAG